MYLQQKNLLFSRSSWFAGDVRSGRCKAAGRSAGMGAHAPHPGLNSGLRGGQIAGVAGGAALPRPSGLRLRLPPPACPSGVSFRRVPSGVSLPACPSGVPFLARPSRQRPSCLIPPGRVPPSGVFLALSSGVGPVRHGTLRRRRACRSMPPAALLHATIPLTRNGQSRRASASCHNRKSQRSTA